MQFHWKVLAWMGGGVALGLAFQATLEAPAWSGAKWETAEGGLQAIELTAGEVELLARGAVGGIELDGPLPRHARLLPASELGKRDPEALMGLGALRCVLESLPVSIGGLLPTAQAQAGQADTLMRLG